MSISSDYCMVYVAYKNHESLGMADIQRLGERYGVKRKNLRQTLAILSSRLRDMEGENYTWGVKDTLREVYD